MYSSLSALFVFISFLTHKAGSMFKALIAFIALLGLFFSYNSTAQSVYEINGSYFGGDESQACQSYCTSVGSSLLNMSRSRCTCNTGYLYGITLTSCDVIPDDQKPPQCPQDTQNFCKDGSIAPNGDLGLCPKYTCSDGQVVDSPSYCSTPFECPDGSTPPNNSVANCPLNCDILSGGGGPECDTEEPPNGYCSETQTPIFDDCQYSPDDPRNPDNQPDPEDHCEQFPDSVSCNTELPELPDTDFCKQYPNALSCQTPEIPDLGTDTNPPPAGGTGVGTDTGTGTGVKPPPPEPPPTNSGSPTASTDARLDSLRYDISRLHSGLNYQTGIIAAGLTGVSRQLQANGGKIDRGNTLLDGINKNLDVLNGGLKGDALTSGNFDVEGGINSALGITGDEKISDLVQEPVNLSDYTEQYDQFLSYQNLSCSNVLPTIEFSVMGKQYSFDINYQPACDWLANLGNFLLFITWIGVPAIVFGRRS